MKSVRKCYILLSILTLLAGTAVAQMGPTAGDRHLLTSFEKAAKDYSKARKRVENTLPKLPTKATPEQIEAHQSALLKRMQDERKGARQGAIFTPESSAVIAAIIREEFKDRDMREVRANMIAAAVGIPVGVNVVYPESKEVMEMPPVLLLRLPQLPEELSFRFAGRTLLLMDRGNRMIIDYLPDAMP